MVDHTCAIEDREEQYEKQMVSMPTTNPSEYQHQQSEKRDLNDITSTPQKNLGMIKFYFLLDNL